MAETFRTPYPDYDVLAKWDSPSWNDVTRDVVAKRLHEVPPRSFFDEHEWRTLEAVCERLIPQPDRPQNPVPIAAWIDHKLAANQTEGYRFAVLPPMQVAWRKALRGIDEDSEQRWDKCFAELAPEQQDAVLRAVQRGEARGASWQELPAAQFFERLLLSDVVSVYYSHPSAWSEIGFGGPASPRGYVRLKTNQSDPWEAKERPDER
jgi:hypothetical protein